jgi:hypothetical protein
VSKIPTCVAVGAVLLLAACSSSSKSSSSQPPATSPPATTAAPTTTAAASKQSLTITPSTGLKDGQVVQVVGKGYTAGTTYSVIECANKGAATGAGDCDLRGIKVATADSTGTVTSPFPVAKGPIGASNVDCSVAPGCLLSVATAGSANPSEVAAAPISFG